MDQKSKRIKKLTDLLLMRTEQTQKFGAGHFLRPSTAFPSPRPTGRLNAEARLDPMLVPGQSFRAPRVGQSCPSSRGAADHDLPGPRNAGVEPTSSFFSSLHSIIVSFPLPRLHQGSFMGCGWVTVVCERGGSGRDEGEGSKEGRCLGGYLTRYGKC